MKKIKKIHVKRLQNSLQGSVIIPGDKSCSQRALMLSSQMLGNTLIKGLLESEDVLATKDALINLGVKIEKSQFGWVVEGSGLGNLVTPDTILDLKNSGTGVRLLMGLISTMGVSATLTGDDSLRSRPMARVINPLSKYSVEFNARDKNYLPIHLQGNMSSTAINHEITVPSAQVKSALLLAGLNAYGESSFIETTLTRDHTEIMMRYLGFDIKEKLEGNKKVININANQDLPAKDITVSGDPSSAAFLVAAAILVKGSNITVKNVLINEHRIGFYKILKLMNAKISFENIREVSGEKVADIKAEYSELKSAKIPAHYAPSTIDEYPILAVLASQAKGVTRMNGLTELKVKESNRLAAIVENLKKCQINVSYGDDWLEVKYSPNIAVSETITTYHDHRIAMSFIILGLISQNGVSIDDITMIDTSFPEFFQKLEELGAHLC